MTFSTGAFVLGLVCLYLTTKGSLLETIWLSLATIDTFRALRLVRANGRRVGIATRRRVMKEALTGWIVSAAITQVDPLLSRLFDWLPFYAPLRWAACLGFLAVRAPACTAIYTSLIRPLLKKYENPLDLVLSLLQTISDIMIYHVVSAPWHSICAIASHANTYRRIFSFEAGTPAAPLEMRDAHGDEDVQAIRSRADLSISTPHIPAQLLRSARKPAVRSTSRAEVGEGSIPRKRQRHVGIPLGPPTSSLSDDVADSALPGASTLSSSLAPRADATADRGSGGSGKKRRVDALDATVPSGYIPLRAARGRPPPRSTSPPIVSSKANPLIPLDLPTQNPSSPYRRIEISGTNPQARPTTQTQLVFTRPSPALAPSAICPPRPGSNGSTSALLRTGPAVRLYPTLPGHVPLPPSLTLSSSSSSATLHRISRPKPFNPIPRSITQPRLHRPTQTNADPGMKSALAPSRTRRPIPASSNLRVHSDALSAQSAKNFSVGSTSSGGSAQGGRSGRLDRVDNRPSGRTRMELGVKGKGNGTESQAKETTGDKHTVVGQKRKADEVIAIAKLVSDKRQKREVGSTSRIRPHEELVKGSVAKEREKRKTPVKARAGADTRVAGEGTGLAKTRVTRGRP